MENYNKHGFGLFLPKSGDAYEAEFSNDKIVGIGKITYKNGDVYLGEIEKLTKTGIGKLTTESLTFEGNFKNDTKDGLGYTFYKDGRVYQGQYKNGKQDGQGEWFSNLNFTEKNIMKVDYYNWEKVKDGVYKVCQNLKPVLSEKEKEIIPKRSEKLRVFIV